MTCSIVNNRKQKRIISRLILTPVGRAPPAPVIFSRDRHLLYFFMCRSTCSRCWKFAIRLGLLHNQLQAFGTTIVLVSSDRNLRPVLKLAADLRLGFQIIGDKDCSIRRQYLTCESRRTDHSAKLLLVDKCGKVRSRFDCINQRDSLAKQILLEVRGLPSS